MREERPRKSRLATPVKFRQFPSSPWPRPLFHCARPGEARRVSSFHFRWAAILTWLLRFRARTTTTTTTPTTMGRGAHLEIRGSWRICSNGADDTPRKPWPPSILLLCFYFYVDVHRKEYFPLIVAAWDCNVISVDKMFNFWRERRFFVKKRGIESGKIKFFLEV